MMQYTASGPCAPRPVTDRSYSRRGVVENNLAGPRKASRRAVVSSSKMGTQSLTVDFPFFRGGGLAG
jgi:hypothetical protein